MSSTRKSALPSRLLLLIPLVLGCAAIAVAILRKPDGPNLTTAIDQTLNRIAALGPLAPIAFAAFYTAAVVLMLPASPLTLAAGALFGPMTGTLAVIFAANLGALLAFLVARSWGRPFVTRWLAKNPRFTALDRAVARAGWRVVALLRLSPAIPFNIQNYAYGLTSIRVVPYVLTNLIAMLPGTFAYIWLGHVGRLGLSAASGGAPHTPWPLQIAGVAATLLVTVYLTHLARVEWRKLDTTTRPEPSPQASPPT